MRVTLLASSTVDFDAYSILPPQAGTSDADYVGVFAGRACYQSFDRPNQKTAPDSNYIASIITKNHESVLSHASATFYVEGVSRSLTHELVRHRWLSFSQLSQRYVDESSADMVVPPVLAAGRHSEALRDVADLEHARAAFVEAVHGAQKAYQEIVEGLGAMPGKRVREAARSVLPNATETKIVVSGNLRAWRDFLKQRLAVGADYEITQLAIELHRLLKEIAPYSFRDLDDTALVAKSVLP